MAKKQKGTTVAYAGAGVYLNISKASHEKAKKEADEAGITMVVQFARMIDDYAKGVLGDDPELQSWLEKEAKANFRTVRAQLAWIVAEAKARSKK